MTPLTLSVIIPTYNRAGYLPEAVESALAQQEVALEVIIVDDGSTDETPAVVAAQAARWGERVRYLRQPNAERGAARNAGLRQAQGTYVAFLDSDDRWQPHHAHVCIRALQRQPGALAVYGEYGLMDAQGRVICRQVRRPVKQGDAFRRLLCLKRLILHPSEMVLRRDALEVEPFDADIPGAEDWALWVRLAAQGAIEAVGETTVWMRVHAHGTFGNPRRFTTSLLAAAERVIATGLPERLGVPARRIRAINHAHSAYAYYLNGAWREAQHCLAAAWRADPAVLGEPDFWQVLAKLCLGRHLSGWIRGLRQRGRGRAGTARHPRILYLSYDGVLEPLGQSQVANYLKGLAGRGAAITLISFEKAADRARRDRMAETRQMLAASGIQWVPLAYHQRPTVLATAYDIAVGTLQGWRRIHQDRLEIVHARSYVPAVMAAALKRLTGARFLFDMRGFWADERLEGGQWSARSPVYRTAKRLERRCLRAADEIITLTEAARDTLVQWCGEALPPVTVIPTCVDLERFPGPPARNGSQPSPVFIYAGSVGASYAVPELLQFFERAIARYPSARLLLVTRQQAQAAACVRRLALSPQAVTIEAADAAEVPGWLSRAHAGLAFYQPGFSRRGTCPTKIGEYLAMGLPVIVNEGVGDTARLVRGANVGAVLPAFSREACDRALDQLARLWTDPQLAARCRQTAEASCSLEQGIEDYWGVYERLRARGSR